MKLLKNIFITVILFNLPVFSQWFAQNTGTSENLRSVFFTNAQTGYACGDNGTIIKTTNGGTNWTALSSGTAFNLRSIQFADANTGLCCGYSGAGGIIIRTTNGGTNWVTVNNPSAQMTNVTFAYNPSSVCVGNSGTTLYSTNSGLNWQVGQPTGFIVTFYTSFMLNVSTGYCGGVNTIFSPLFAKTTNGGANWTYSSFLVNNNEATLYDLYFFNEQTGFATSILWNGQGGISHTTNGGTNWTHQIVTPALYGIDFPGTMTGYIAGGNGAIYKSTDGGTSWSIQASGTNQFLRGIDFIDSLLGFAAGDNGVILKTTNGGVLAVKPVSNEIPDKFSLFQNYPNPFNPTTKIRFSLPLNDAAGGSYVKLIIYDNLGRDAVTLINKTLSPGTYEVEWDASDYPSGVYYYQLTVSSEQLTFFTETKKMVLVK